MHQVCFEYLQSEAAAGLIVTQSAAHLGFITMIFGNAQRVFQNRTRVSRNISTDIRVELFVLRIETFVLRVEHFVFRVGPFFTRLYSLEMQVGIV